MKIRKATEKDKKIILKILNSEPTLIDDDNLLYREIDIEQYMTSPIETFVYIDNNEIIGLISCVFWNINKTVNIYHLIVKKELRGKGIGKALLKYIENLSKKKNYGLVWFYSEVNNHSMHNFGKKYDYKKGKKLYFFSKDLENKK